MSDNRTRLNPAQMARQQVDLASHHLDIDPGVMQKITATKREVTVHFPVRLDDGSLRMFTGYRVQHNDTRGPFKGGIRYHPDTDKIGRASCRERV